jgi:hypothetical protein
VRSLVMTMVRGRTAAIAIALLMSATVAGTAGCAAVRNGLGTSSSVCFRAIPVGRGAVTPPSSTTQSSNGQSSNGQSSNGQSSNGQSSNGQSSGKPVQSTFVGVRSATQKDIDTFGSAHNYLRSQLTEKNGGPLKSLCLVAFHGSFDPASVHDLLGVVPPPGHRDYLVAVVSEPSNKLIATFIRSKEPISFTHYVVGG